MAKHTFTEQQETEIVRRYVAGESSNNIVHRPPRDEEGRPIKTNGRTVLNVLERHGVSRRSDAAGRNPTISEVTRQRVVELCKAGGHIKEVAIACGVGKTFVSEALREAGIILPSGNPNTRKNNAWKHRGSRD